MLHTDLMISKSVPTTFSDSTLVNAVVLGRVDCALDLLEQDNVDITKDDQGVRALYKSALEGYTDIVRILIYKYKVNVNFGAGLQGTALMCASENGHEQIVDMLLAQPGISVNACNVLNDTALTLAARNAHVAIVKKLLANEDTDVNVHDMVHGQNALISLVYQMPIVSVGVDTFVHDNFLDVINDLIMHDRIDVNAVDHHGYTALMMAIQRSNYCAIDSLLASDAIDINKVNDFNRTALTVAANSALYMPCLWRVVRMLMRRQDINLLMHEQGRMTLFFAIEDQMTDIVHYLISKKEIDINATNESGSTALMHAAAVGQPEIVAILLNSPRTEVNATNNAGMSALDIAKENNNTAVVELLVSHGASCTITRMFFFPTVMPHMINMAIGYVSEKFSNVVSRQLITPQSSQEISAHTQVDVDLEKSEHDTESHMKYDCKGALRQR